MDTTRTHQRRATRLSTIFAVTGIAVVTVLAMVQSVPRPWWLWLLLTGVYLALDFTAVEVNDRLKISSAVMVTFAAAVIFGPDSRILAVVVMSALAALHPRDLREGRWRVGAANLGVLVVSTTVAMLVFQPFLPSETPTASDLPLLAPGSVVAAVTFDWVGFRLVRFMTGRIFPGQELRPWSSLMPNHAALTLLAAFGALLGAAYHMSGSVVLALMGAIFVVGQLAFSSYARLREAHLATLSGFVKAIEALDRHTRGHTERVARFCEIAGTNLGLGPEDLERLRWAALIHDVGKVAVPGELLRSAEEPTGEVRSRMQRRMQVVDEMLAGVDFLSPIVRIVADYRSAEDRRPDRIEARILAVADDFDSMTATRSHRQAVTQTEAFSELRRNVDRYGCDAVEALIEAIESRGEIHGLPEAASAAEVDRLVRERSARA